MANPTCSFCGQAEAVYMGVNLQDGDTQQACNGCLPVFALGMTAAMVKVMSKAEAEAYADALDAIYASDPRGPKPPPAAPRKRAAKAKAAQVASDGSEAAVAVTVELDEPCPQCGSHEALGDDHKLTCSGCGTVLQVIDPESLSGVS